MHYANKADVLPMIDPDDPFDPAAAFNRDRQVINNHHKALGNYTDEIERMQIHIALLALAVGFLSLIVLLPYAIWVYSHVV